MNKEKTKFNFIDLIILLIILAAVFILLYVFVLSGKETSLTDTETVTIEYVVEIQNLDSNLCDYAAKGDNVQDAIKRRGLGTVTGIEKKPYRKLTYNYTDNCETSSEVPEKSVLLLTIEAEAVETDRSFSVNDCPVRVGELYSLILPDMYVYGYCISVVKK